MRKQPQLPSSKSWRWWFKSQRRALTRSLPVFRSQLVLSRWDVYCFFEAVEISRVLTINVNPYLEPQRSEMRGELSVLEHSLTKQYPLSNVPEENRRLWQMNIQTFAAFYALELSSTPS